MPSRQKDDSYQMIQQRFQRGEGLDYRQKKYCAYNPE
jgi:hypothetical protein